MKALRAGLDTVLPWAGFEPACGPHVVPGGPPVPRSGPPPAGVSPTSRNRVSIHAAAATHYTAQVPLMPWRLLFLAAVLFLGACSDKPVIVSADTSCERFRHISATDAQRGAMKADWSLWESLGVQVAAHNTEFDKDCLKSVQGP